MIDHDRSHDTFYCTIAPRYTDLDTWRHVNNSRLYQMHQEARMLAHIDRFGPDAWFSDTVRLRPLRTITNYRLVTWYGSDVQAEVRILGCDGDTFRVRSELFQNGEQVGSQECLMAAFDQGERVALPTATAAALKGAATGASEPLPPADYIALLQAVRDNGSHYPLIPRYADLDADALRSEAALALYMEQARFSTIRRLDMGEAGMLIAQADISFDHFRPGSQPVDLAAAVSRIGNTSFVFTGCASTPEGTQVSANSVMVAIDKQTNRPLPLPAALRAQLETLSIKP